MANAEKATIREALENNIENITDAIRPDLLEKVAKNGADAVYHVNRSRGRNMLQFILKN